MMFGNVLLLKELETPAVDTVFNEANQYTNLDFSVQGCVVINGILKRCLWPPSLIGVKDHAPFWETSGVVQVGGAIYVNSIIVQ